MNNKVRLLCLITLLAAGVTTTSRAVFSYYESTEQEASNYLCYTVLVMRGEQYVGCKVTDNSGAESKTTFSNAKTIPAETCKSMCGDNYSIENERPGKNPYSRQ